MITLFESLIAQAVWIRYLTIWRQPPEIQALLYAFVEAHPELRARIGRDTRSPEE